MTVCKALGFLKRVSSCFHLAFKTQVILKRRGCCHNVVKCSCGICLDETRLTDLTWKRMCVWSCPWVGGTKVWPYTLGHPEQQLCSSGLCLLLCSTFVPFRAVRGEFVWLLTFPEHLSACDLSCLSPTNPMIWHTSPYPLKLAPNWALMDENVQVSAVFPDCPISCHAAHSPQACVTSSCENDKSEDELSDCCKCIYNLSDTQ